VHLQNLANGLTAQAVPAVVDVRLRGQADPLAGVAPDDISAFVDLAGLGAGQYTLTVKATAPGDIGVTTITPASVQVRITSVQH
jgi:YbbR domain-containing protein